MKQEKKEYYKAIVDLLTIIENNYRYKYGNKIQNRIYGRIGL